MRRRCRTLFALGALAAASTRAPPTTAPNPYRDRRGNVDAARRPDVGIAQRRRRRQGRHDHLGRRALWRQQRLPRIADRRSDSSIRCDPAARKSFGAGLLVSPHGIYVDRDGNIWVTDYQDNAPARGTRPAAASAAAAALTGPVGAAGRRDEGPPGVQVQPGRQAADDARRARRRRRSGVLLSAERRDRRPQRRHLRLAGTRSGQVGDAEILERRHADQAMGQDRHRARTNSISRTRSRSIRRDGSSSATATTTGSRSSIRTATSSTSGRSSAGRAGIFIDKARQHLRRRLRVGFGGAQSSRAGSGAFASAASRTAR